MIVAGPPVRYKHWSGKIGLIKNHEELFDTWHYPSIEEWQDADLEMWRPLGWAPQPKTRWRGWWFNWHHGRLMGFPFLSVLAYCVRELMDSF